MSESGPVLRTTEHRNPRSADIDMLDPAALVDLFNAEDATVPAAVAAARSEIADAIGRVEQAFRDGGRLLYVGAGTSGRLGVLDASECPPTFGTPPDLVQGIIAGGLDALVRSVEGAEDDPTAGAAAIAERGVAPRDIVAGIAASGTTPFVRGALVAARARGATTILVTCALPAGDMADLVDLLIHLDVGPEIVTGSTRLKAGTATKLVLNMLTTGALIRLGKTYGNLMVDLQATNAKLRQRGTRMVAQVSGVTEEVAGDMLQRASGRVRTAIVMAFEGIDASAAEARLAAVDRRLRAIVGPPPPVG
ncbi:MAG: N-acetylmuramic acid 6-phosphate etherase [Gemmatimonadales bacterium]